MSTATLTDEQTAGVERLVMALEELGQSLLACKTIGLDPADAFRAAGVDIPMFAGPALNSMFSKHVQPAPDTA